MDKKNEVFITKFIILSYWSLHWKRYQKNLCLDYEIHIKHPRQTIGYNILSHYQKQQFLSHSQKQPIQSQGTIFFQ